ncbi:hypothetical protein K710_0602 [Streptococcus iniae SF1]|nr:hypothetical protein K710_0602 [Streptococcus iniae SF1]
MNGWIFLVLFAIFVIETDDDALHFFKLRFLFYHNL